MKRIKLNQYVVAINRVTSMTALLSLVTGFFYIVFMAEQNVRSLMKYEWQQKKTFNL